MSAIDVLRNEYPGDEAWHRFVMVFRPHWVTWQDKDSYLAKFGDEEIAVVLTASMGTYSIDWFDKPCGALGKRTPADVARNEVLGNVILRTLLMRMPR